MKRRVKINKLPKNYMQDGGSVNKSLSPVPREEANLEAEKGEVAQLKEGGDTAVYNIGGKRHSEGGTPLSLAPGSRIFSDTKKMKIKDKETLSEFGFKKPVTPAKIAKKYSDTNDFRASLGNPFADDIEKNTARMMIDKNESKLNDLFMVQEAMKGFPQGIPGEQGTPMAKYGMQLPKAQGGVQTGSTLQEREQKLKQLESQRRRISSDPNLRSIEKDRKMTELNRAIALEQQYINKMSREEVARPTSTEQSGQTQSPIFAPSYSTPDNPIIYEAPAETQPVQSTSRPVASGTSRSTSGNPRRVPVYTDAYQQMQQAGQDASNYTFTPGATAYEDGQVGTRPARQGRRGDGTYGEEDLISRMDDFYARNPWVKEERPNFDPTSKEDTGWFQNRYEELNKLAHERARLPYSPYFVEGDKEGRAFDKMFGEHTYNAPSFVTSETPVKLESKTPTEIVPEEEPEMKVPGFTPAKARDAKPFEQDLRNERLVARNRASERLRLPWRGRLAARTADPTYQSDVQQQQNILAGLNTASEAATAFGSNPGAVMSNVMRMSGLAGNQSNQIAAALQKENTGIANQFEQFNTQQQAATDVRNTANAQDLYDNTIKAQEVFDEKMRRYNILGTATRNATDTNLARIKAMNKLNPMFTINTGDGPQYGDFQFQPGVSAASFDANQSSADENRRNALQAFRQQIIEDPSYGDSDKRIDLIKQIDEDLLNLNKGTSVNTAQQQALNMYGAGMQGVGFAMPGMNPYMGVNPGYGMNPYGMRSPYGFRYGGYYDEE